MQCTDGRTHSRKGTCLNMLFSYILNSFVGHLLSARPPQPGCWAAHSGEKAFLSRGPRRTVPSGELGLVTSITISLQLSLDFLCVGHEHPYGIQKSNLPATVLLILKLEDSTSDSTQGPRELPGQFILKPRHPGRHQQPKMSKRFPSCKCPLLAHGSLPGNKLLPWQ